MEAKNQEQATVVNNEQQPVENKKGKVLKTAKNVALKILECTACAALGAITTYVLCDKGILLKDKHFKAQAQDAYLNRKNGNV